jgi:murein DD-endopeptidase MepM/ murein hydrolase activator NlpD
MIQKIPGKVIAYIFLGIFSLVLLIGVGALAINAPAYYPDDMIAMGDLAIGFFERVTLSIKLTELAVHQPDKVILMPVYGVRVSQVADTWHEPRPDDRLHEGQDIFAKKGTPIFSGAPGYVVGFSTSDLGGNSVYVRGSGGRTYFYTHLDRFPDELRIGQRVSTDTVIGFVGNSGNAETTPSHLHFGVYALGQAINPLPLLVDRPRPQ